MSVFVAQCCRYLLHSAVIAFALQALTGILLMTAYEPSARPALSESGKRVVIWEMTGTLRHAPSKITYKAHSYLFAEYDTANSAPLLALDTLHTLSRSVTHPATNQVLSPSQAYLSVEQGIMRFADFGVLVRGVHRASSHLLIGLMLVWFVLSVLSKNFLQIPLPAWCSAVALVAALHGSGLTGYILPFDTRGFHALEILTSTLDSTPLGGQTLASMIRGASDSIGALSLLRVYVLHVALLPVLAVFCWVVLKRREQLFPAVQYFLKSEQFPKLLVIAGLVVWLSVSGGSVLLSQDSIPNLPADLTQPAFHNPSDMPEWYFYPIFLCLQFLQSGVLTWGLMICFIVLVLMPLAGRVGNIFAMVVHQSASILVLAWFIAATIGLVRGFTAARVAPLSEEMVEILVVTTVLTIALCGVSILLLRTNKQRQ